jgi:hypothetical protein
MLFEAYMSDCVKCFMFTVFWLSFSSTPVDVNNREMMLSIINSSITTKVISRWSSLACNIALDAVKTVQFEENGRKEIDIKKYARVEKVSLSSMCLRVRCLAWSFLFRVGCPYLLRTRQKNWTTLEPGNNNLRVSRRIPDTIFGCLYYLPYTRFTRVRKDTDVSISMPVGTSHW